MPARVRRRFARPGRPRWAAVKWSSSLVFCFLRFDSPAIDAGHSGGLTTDQRGLPRPIDDPNTPNAEGGDGSDIGAYEGDPNLRITGIGRPAATFG